jgi:hypothetical protein
MFNAGERFDQGGAHYFELAAMVGRQPVEQSRALGGDTQQDAAGVALVGGALQQTLLDGAICQLHHAVVPQAEALGRVGDGGDGGGRRSGNLQQQLVLLGLQAGIVSGLLTELDEGAKAIAKFGQAFEQTG